MFLWELIFYTKLPTHTASRKEGWIKFLLELVWELISHYNEKFSLLQELFLLITRNSCNKKFSLLWEILVRTRTKFLIITRNMFFIIMRSSCYNKNLFLIITRTSCYYNKQTFSELCEKSVSKFIIFSGGDSFRVGSST